MPEMDDGERTALPGLVDRLFHFNSRAVIGHKNFEVTKSLPCACGKDKPQDCGLVVDGDDQGDQGLHMGHKLTLEDTKKS